MHFIGSTLDLNVDCRAAGETLFRIEVVRYNVDAFNGFESGNVSRHVREENIVLAGSVNARVVGTGSRTIDVILKSARRISWN